MYDRTAILVLGCSSIATRRFVPAVKSVLPDARISFATRSRRADAAAFLGPAGLVYDTYDAALSHSDAAIAYVSLTNEAHAMWVEAALLSGRHVIVDKPAFLSLSESERLVRLAASRNLVLAEATVFLDHAQFADHRADWPGGKGGARVDAHFSMPGFPADNFRYQAAMGGGAIWDLGPYAAAVSRYFFGKPPQSVDVRILTRHPETQVDTAFAVLFAYDGGGAMTGLFGFDTEYRNELSVFSADGAATLSRAFTTPPDLSNTIAIRRQNEPCDIVVAPSDAFSGFVTRFLAAVDAKDGTRFGDDLLMDSALLERIREAAGANYDAD